MTKLMMMIVLIVLVLTLNQLSFIDGLQQSKNFKQQFLSNSNQYYYNINNVNIIPTELYLLQNHHVDNKDQNNDNNDNNIIEPMFSINYDPLELPDSATFERDLEDMLMEKALRFYDKKVVKTKEKCFLVGLDDKSETRNDMINSKIVFTMEESLTELSELAGAAGLTVVGSTYQRLQKPDIQYYIGQGKTKDIRNAMMKHNCACVIFDTELSPSQQKNLELTFNQDRSKDKMQIKVIDRTALILDIFAQHARTREGQLQVQLAMLTYRLPRLTNMWTHLERQSAGARGKSNGGVGLRGPGEKQLESDRRIMKSKISILNQAIDSVRRHRAMHRNRRRRLGMPVIAMVGYTNSGKSTLLNTFTNAGVFAADMLFATLDPTTRLVQVPGMKYPDILLTDTVGFIQKLPTHLVAAFRATLEEIVEADVLLHIADISNDAWRKQEAAVLKELSDMGLSDKPVVTVWNKIDTVPNRKEFIKYEAKKRGNTVALSATTGEGFDDLLNTLENVLSSKMEFISMNIPYDQNTIMNSIHNLGSIEEIQYLDDGMFVRAHIPKFLYEQLISWDEKKRIANLDDDDYDWTQLAKGRHTALKQLELDDDNDDDDDEEENYLVIIDDDENNIEDGKEIYKVQFN